MPAQIFCPLFFCPLFHWTLLFLLMSFEGLLYNLDTSPLSDMCFAGISSQFMAYLFILLTVSFEEQKSSEVQFMNFCLWWIVLLVLYLRILWQTKSQIFTSRRFTVSGFIFRPDWFWVNFCIWCSTCYMSKFWGGFFFFFCHEDIQYFQHYLLQRLFFLHWIPFAPLHCRKSAT